MDANAFNFVREVAVPVLVGAGGTVLADGLFRSVQTQQSEKKTHIPLGVAIAVTLILGGVAFFIARKLPSHGPEASAQQKTVLQNVQCQPCSVRPGDWVTITAWLNQAVAHGSPSFLVHLNVSDGAVISGNNTIEVKPDVRSANTHFQVVRLPSYLDSIDVEATDEAGSRANASISVLKNSSPHVDSSAVHTSKPKEPQPFKSDNDTVAPKPPAPDPELLDRLGDAQGRLTSEESYWENVKAHMRAGSSIRPEITSQIHAAQDASRRCDGYRQQGNVPDLRSCVDTLNDHLRQLSDQH